MFSKVIIIATFAAALLQGRVRIPIGREPKGRSRWNYGTDSVPGD